MPRVKVLREYSYKVYICFILRSSSDDMITAAEKAGKDGGDMKKVFLVFLSLCMLLCAAAAEEAPAEDGSPAADECLIRLWDRSGVECAYIRFAMWQGDAQLGYVLSCPNEGEDFCRCSVYADQMKAADGEAAEPLRIVLSFGYSEQNPEDAILSAMMGNPVTEEECCEMTLEPAFGGYADYELTADETGRYILVPVQ